MFVHMAPWLYSVPGMGCSVTLLLSHNTRVGIPLPARSLTTWGGCGAAVRGQKQWEGFRAERGAEGAGLPAVSAWQQLGLRPWIPLCAWWSHR